MTCESRGILLETVKPAEEGSDLILRLYESLGTSEDGVLRLPFRSHAWLCSMEEKKESDLGCGDRFHLSTGAFEILTVRIEKC